VQQLQWNSMKRFKKILKWAAVNLAGPVADW
jgi:hypothetical protein